MASATTYRITASQSSLLLRLYEKSGGQKYGQTAEQFGAVLCEVVAKYLPVNAASQDAEELLCSLRVEELALARACAAGNEAAWTEFLTRFREPLYRMAYAITRNDVLGRELADSLYADLYGTSLHESDGKMLRKSKLDLYMGRGSLEGWLRTVLAQEYVNRYRQKKRLVSLDEECEAGVQFAAAPEKAAVPVDPRLVAATDSALAALVAEERLILASYFLDQRTLAEIARMLGVHESTISRKLERIVKNLRKRILKEMALRGMSARAAEEALESDVRDLTVNVAERLRPQSATEKMKNLEASPQEINHRSFSEYE